MTTRIPIFPLKLVVFPSSKYPLHIFEERYKKMISHCIHEKEGFGIIAVLNEEMSRVGTLVHVKEVIQTYDTGELDIIVEADNRIEVADVSMHGDGYFTGLATDYEDDEENIDRGLQLKLVNALKALLDKLNFKIGASYWRVLTAAKYKSFKIAEKAGLTLEQQQVLINMKDENGRVRFLLDHLEVLCKTVDESPIYKNLFINDGYLS